MVYRLGGGALRNFYFYLYHGSIPLTVINSNEKLSESSIIGITCSEVQKQYFICKHWDYILVTHYLGHISQMIDLLHNDVNILTTPEPYT